jgi:hypothetical protein
MFDLKKKQELDLHLYTFLATPGNMVMPKIPTQLHMVFGYTEDDGAKQVQGKMYGQPANLELGAKTKVVDLIKEIGRYVDLTQFDFAKVNRLDLHHKIINGMIASAESLTSTPQERDILIKALMQVDSLLTDSYEPKTTIETEGTLPTTSAGTSGPSTQEAI